MGTITWSDFEKIDMRTGTILRVEDYPEARNPAYKIYIDFGELGERKTSAQLTKLYSKDELVGKQIIAVVNFPPKQIGKFMSECLVLGVIGENKEVSLLTADHKLGNGFKIG